MTGEKGNKSMEKKVLEVLEEYCEEALDYTGDNMMEEGVIDSFTVINVVSELEDVFDIEIDAKYVVAENFRNKEAIIELVRQLVED
jgi:acyl carrier protein